MGQPLSSQTISLVTRLVIVRVLVVRAIHQLPYRWASIAWAGVRPNVLDLSLGSWTTCCICTSFSVLGLFVEFTMASCKLWPILALVGSLLSLCYCQGDSELTAKGGENREDLSSVEWWKKSNYYHIYLRSFKDSDGDGNGDLRGVVEKLDYLQQIGVQTILMAPFYSSPMKDGGYDIDDYLGINPMFGTMQDFDDLIGELKLRNMRIVVDFVPNHSSDKHPWFECSERALIEPERCGKYKDYYIWTNSTRYQGKYPSNWISVFGGGPAWTWSKLRKEFYLHQFLPQQPDLNFTNPLVREEFKEITRFWLRKGADGLRVDSAIFLIEDTVNYSDEPLDPNWREGDDPADRLKHIFTRALPESARIVKDWREVAEEAEFTVSGPRVIITEAYDAIPKLIEYYGTSPSDRYADMPFNFELFKLKANNLDAEWVERVAMNWIEPTRNLSWPDEHGAMAPWICWVTGNHDNPRLANRIGHEMVPIFKWISYLLPGVPVNYYGDELPLHDINYNAIPERTIREGEPSRLPERSPIAWTDEEPSGGFSASRDIWLPLQEDYKTRNNVRRLLSNGSEPKNQLKLFLRLERLRKDEQQVFIFGDLIFFKNEPLESSKSVLALARAHKSAGGLLLLVNFDRNNELVVRLRANKSAVRRVQVEPPKSGQIVLTNFEDTSRAPLVREGARLELEGLVLAARQAAIVKF